MKKVLLLALGDKHWTQFVLVMSEKLTKAGIPVVIAMESRLGEYQVFLKRINYPAEIYYLTDFLEKQKQDSKRGGDVNDEFIAPMKTVMCDFNRLLFLGASSTLKNTCWQSTKDSISKYFNEIFEQNDIGVVVHDVVSTSISYICYLKAVANNIQYYGLVGARVPDRYEIRKSIYEEDQEVKYLYEDIVNRVNPATADELAWAENYINTIDDQIPTYMKSGILNKISLSSFMNKKYLKLFAGTILYKLKEDKDAQNIIIREEPIRSVLRSYYRNLSRYVKKSIGKRFMEYVTKDWCENHNYYIYPLHYQPEASTLIGSPHYNDQINFLINTAFSLPENHYLLVKEHISNYSYPKHKFYETIKMLPNVKLIAPDANIKQLIRDSKGVITLTSTAGFEALLLDIPVYMFGRVFYNFHPLCKVLTSWDELEKCLNDGLTSQDYNNLHFLIAYKRYTRPLALNFSEKDFLVADDLVNVISHEIVSK